MAQQPAILRIGRRVIAFATVVRRCLQHALGYPNSPQRMFYTTMGGTPVKKVGHAELMHATQPLKRWVVDDLYFLRIKPSKPGDGQKDFLTIFGVGPIVIVSN